MQLGYLKKSVLILDMRRANYRLQINLIWLDQTSLCPEELNSKIGEKILTIQQWSKWELDTSRLWPPDTENSKTQKPKLSGLILSSFHCFFLGPVALFLSFLLPTNTHVPKRRRSICTILELCHIIISHFIGCVLASLHYYRLTVSFSSTFASLRHLCDARSRLWSTLQLYPVCGSKLFMEQRSHRRNLIHEPHFSE